MTTAVAPAPLPPIRRLLPPFPTAAALGLERATRAELELAFVRGGTPALADLAGWEFRGINHPASASLAGIKKFMKGFVWEDGRAHGTLYGYNCPIEQNVLDGRWRARPEDAAPKRFGFYRVAAVDPTHRDNAYLHAVLLDYGAGGNKSWDLSAGLRDYLVQLSDDLFLGKAYYALGPLRVHSNFFILERHRRGLTDFARR
ncbi:MAG: hypothetical protein NT062_21920 [Proteobacteria bacterium]|nr:hypothetical protein [Pseudomonadota bacterium]